VCGGSRREWAVARLKQQDWPIRGNEVGECGEAFSAVIGGGCEHAERRLHAPGARASRRNVCEVRVQRVPDRAVERVHATKSVIGT
jgi:hypothetical protein